MNKNTDLLGYLPPFVARFGEMKKIMTAENPEFDLLRGFAEQIKNDLFISGCGEEGIKRFEKILGIIPSELDTLESRRSRVLARWLDMIPYTYRVLLNKLDVLCGKENYEIDLNAGEYLLKLVTHLEMYGQTDEIRTMLRDIVPANIALNLKNNIDCTTTGTMYIGGWVCGADSVTVTNDFDESADVRNFGVFKAAVSCTETVTAV